MKRLALLFVLASVPAFANPGPGTTAVKAANDTIAKQLKTNAPAAAVIKSVNALIDIDQLCKDAIGSTQWSAMKPQEQADLLLALHQAIEARYTQGQTLNPSYQVNYLGESTNTAGNIVVKTEIVSKPKGRPVTLDVDYELDPHSLRAIDVVTGGSSLEQNYSQQFASIIAKNGVSGLIAKMQQATQKLQSQGSGSGSSSSSKP